MSLFFFKLLNNINKTYVMLMWLDETQIDIINWEIDKAMSRSSHQRCSMWKGVLRNFAKFTRKHQCQSLFLKKVAGLRPATLFKKRLRHKCFSVNFLKFLRTPFLQNTSGRLVLMRLVLNFLMQNNSVY